MKKATHEEADYRQGGDLRRCAFCLMFRGPRACTAVESPVSKDGLCDYFKRGGNHGKELDRGRD